MRKELRTGLIQITRNQFFLTTSEFAEFELFFGQNAFLGVLSASAVNFLPDRLSYLAGELIRFSACGIKTRGTILVATFRPCKSRKHRRAGEFFDRARRAWRCYQEEGLGRLFRRGARRCLVARRYQSLCRRDRSVVSPREPTPAVMESH
jgi:hypothetical protein